ADRHVDIARDDHQRHADRGDRDIGIADEDAGQVGDAEEARVVEADADDHQLLAVGFEDRLPAADRHGARHVLQSRRHDAAAPVKPAGADSRLAPTLAAVIAAPTASGVASLRSNWPTMRPPRITSTRSLMPRTSGSSLEIISTASPWPASRLIKAWISALAPTSMPRVGSSMMRTRGSVATHFASTTFCWLPPESCFTRCSGPRVRIPKRSIERFASALSCPRSTTKALAMRSRIAS